MNAHPHDPRSSGATVALIAAVVICVLILGMLALFVLGVLFFSVSSVEISPGSVTAPTVYPEPMQTATIEDRPVLEELSGVPEAVTGSESTTEPREMTVDRPTEESPPDASPESPTAPPDEKAPVDVPASPVAPMKKLADLTPMEVVDVQAGDEPLVRTVQVAGQSHPNAIWAQPIADQGTCQVSYQVQQEYTRLTGVAAIADAAAGDVVEVPKATFRIYGDGNLLWDSGPLQGYGNSKSFDLEIDGIRLLALVAESDVSSAASRCAWVDMQISPKQEPASP